MNPRTIASSILTLLREAGWAPSLVFIVHVFISRMLNAYVLFPPLDIPMHFFGGVVIAFFIWRCFAALPHFSLAPELRRAVVGLLVFGFTAAATVFWEFAEFFSDRLFHTSAQLSLEDTLLDMALGLFGGLCWLAVAVRRRMLSVYAPLFEQACVACRPAG
jgi:hypothetical protein